MRRPRLLLTPDNKKTGRQRGFHLRAPQGLNLRPLAPELKFVAAACCKALLIALRKAKSDGIVLPSVAVCLRSGASMGASMEISARCCGDHSSSPGCCGVLAGFRLRSTGERSREVVGWIV
jgi:hypothetical protein